MFPPTGVINVRFEPKCSDGQCWDPQSMQLVVVRLHFRQPLDRQVNRIARR